MEPKGNASVGLINFTEKELQSLLKDSNSHVHLKKHVKYPIQLRPACLNNISAASKEMLNAKVLKYIPEYEGILLSFKNVVQAGNYGKIRNDDFHITINVYVDLYIFAPTVNCTLSGVVSKRSDDNIGCLVHKGFNVSIPRPVNLRDWQGDHLNLGDEITLQVDRLNLRGNLPYIRGKLLESTNVERKRKLSLSDDQSESASVDKTFLLHKDKKKKSKKNREDESETNTTELLESVLATSKGSKSFDVSDLGSNLEVKKKKKSKNKNDETNTLANNLLESAIQNIYIKKRKKSKREESSTSEIESKDISPALIKKTKASSTHSVDVMDAISKSLLDSSIANMEIMSDVPEVRIKRKSKSREKDQHVEADKTPIVKPCEEDTDSIAKRLLASAIVNLDEKKKKKKSKNGDKNILGQSDGFSVYSIEPAAANIEIKKRKLKNKKKQQSDSESDRITQLLLDSAVARMEVNKVNEKSNKTDEISKPFLDAEIMKMTAKKNKKLKKKHKELREEENDTTASHPETSSSKNHNKKVRKSGVIDVSKETDRITKSLLDSAIAKLGENKTKIKQSDTDAVTRSLLDFAIAKMGTKKKKRSRDKDHKNIEESDKMTKHLLESAMANLNKNNDEGNLLFISPRKMASKKQSQISTLNQPENVHKYSNHSSSSDETFTLTPKKSKKIDLPVFHHPKATSDSSDAEDRQILKTSPAKKSKTQDKKRVNESSTKSQIIDNSSNLSSASVIEQSKKRTKNSKKVVSDQNKGRDIVSSDNLKALSSKLLSNFLLKTNQNIVLDK